uniref:Uncharacterized protein n=1 Tax=Rubinisphaera brasiliensis (strain ATCC 49424 / DSM 5305 / JCM 21570 / IAM 15109 / NBRC 103401 / IFAM 1448) TaxID=756272 RepID=F0SKR5_RUBBR|nr:hypothetical protein Plabr_1118 [Rubinisphaera brasiliensis DSM 5305]
MTQQTEEQFVVVCHTGRDPKIVPVPKSFDYSHKKTLVKRADRSLPYPKYLMKGVPRGIAVCCDDSGALKRLPVNRWGIIGDFVVCRTFSATNRGLKHEDAESAVRHLTEEYGYLRPDCGVCNISHGGVGFWGPHVKAPHQLEQDGREFDPDLHFTGVYNEPEVTFINWLTSHFSQNVVAAHAYSPFPKCFSLELQFGASEQDQERMQECLGLYENAFTKRGKLKTALHQHPPKHMSRSSVAC